MSTEPIRYPIEVPGAQAAAAAFDHMAQSQAASQRAADAAVGSTKELAEAAKVAALASTQASRAANTQFDGITKGAKGGAIAIGSFANAAMGLIPGLDGMGAAVSRASGTIGAMTMSIGAGPLGIIAGGVVAALGIYSEYTKQAKEDSEALTKSVEDTTDSFQQLQLASTWVEDVLSRATFMQRMNAKQVQGVILGLRLQLDSPLTSKEALDGLRGELAEAQGIAAALTLLKPGATLAGTGQEEAPAAKKAKVLKPIDIFPDNPIQNASDARAKEARAGIDAAAERGKGVRAEYDAKQAMLASMREDQKETFRLMGQQQDEHVDHVLEGYKKQKAESKKTAKVLTDAGVGAWMAVGASAGQAFQMIAAGEKVSSKQVLASLGSTLIGQGTGYIFQGTALSILGEPQGPPLIGVGAAEVAFGMALGAAGRSNSAAGGGGGAASPTYSTTNIVDHGAERYVTEVHIHAGVVGDPAAMGVELDRYLRSAARSGRIDTVSR